MTKEEIIRKYEPYPNKAEVDIIGTMMDEFAKQQAIAFAKFVLKEWNIHAAISGTMWGSDDEVYNQFIESQNNNTK